MIIDSNNQSLEVQVFSYIEDGILSGKYKSGEQLTELGLTKEIGVSRTPIRSALHRLSEEGLVELTPNRRVVVLGVTKEDVIDTYKIRMRLDGLASRLCAELIDKEKISELREVVELSEFYISKNNPEKIKQLDTEFHHIIYEATGNRMLAKILGDLHKKIKVYRKASLSVSARPEKSVKEHREILEAIERGDGDEAERLTSLHIENAMRNILLSFEN